MTVIFVQVARMAEGSTTAADAVDGLETGWTGPHFSGPARPKWTKTADLAKVTVAGRIPTSAPNYQVESSVSGLRGAKNIIRLTTPHGDPH